MTPLAVSKTLTTDTFEERRAREILEHAGLKIEALSYGSWRNPGGWRYQDVFVVSKNLHGRGFGKVA